jgi:putative addiction module component (TIGR02574 family)
MADRITVLSEERPMSKAELKQAIRELPFPERVELLEELWREAETEQPELLDWQKEILDERLRDAEAHPEDWVSWEEAKLRLERLAQGRG